MAMVHVLFRERLSPSLTEWDNEGVPNQERIRFAWYMAEAAQVGCQQASREMKVPRWILRFALRSLSLDPLPQKPVVADCLRIVATDLGCHVPNIKTLDKRHV